MGREGILMGREGEIDGAGAAGSGKVVEIWLTCVCVCVCWYGEEREMGRTVGGMFPSQPTSLSSTSTFPSISTFPSPLLYCLLSVYTDEELVILSLLLQQVTSSWTITSCCLSFPCTVPHLFFLSPSTLPAFPSLFHLMFPSLLLSLPQTPALLSPPPAPSPGH